MARLASRAAQTGEVLEVSARGAKEFVAHLPLTLLPGVDAAWAEWLRDMKLHTAGDLAALSAEAVARTFGERGLRLWEIARGEDPVAAVAVEAFDEGEEVSAQVGIRPATEDRVRIHGALRIAAAEVAAKLAQEGKAAWQVRVELGFDDLRSLELRRTLPVPTAQRGRADADRAGAFSARAWPPPSGPPGAGACAASGAQRAWGPASIAAAEVRCPRYSQARTPRGLDAVRGSPVLGTNRLSPGGPGSHERRSCFLFATRYRAHHTRIPTSWSIRRGCGSGRSGWWKGSS